MFLDIETTGLPFKRSKWDLDYDKFPRPVSACWFTDDYKYYIINQEGHKIPEAASAIHGLTNDITDRSNWKMQEVLLWLIDAAENADRIIGYNIYFDTSIIKANVCRVFGADGHMIAAAIKALDKVKRIDVMRALGKYNKGFVSMEDTYYRMFGEHYQGHHAQADVQALRRIYEHALENNYMVWKGLQQESETL